MKVKAKPIIIGVLALAVVGSAMPSDDAPQETDKRETVEQVKENPDAVSASGDTNTEAEQEELKSQYPEEEKEVPAAPVKNFGSQKTAPANTTPSETLTPEQAFRESLKQYVYVGSSESDKYHRPTCRWTDKINDGNLVHFDTKEEATAAGYSPCGTCNP